MTIRQLFCTVADLVADMEKPGGDEARLYQAILEASDVLQKEIGWFIPVTQTTKMRGSGKAILYPNVPVLALTGSITNDGSTLIVDIDFVFLDRMWANGPYYGMEGKTINWCNQYSDSVQIPCRVGLCELNVDLGITVQEATSQSSSLSTLKVSDGGKISPGMHLLIGTEQELVTGWDTPTASITTLNGAITANDDIVTVANGALVNIGEIARAGFEQMKVLDKQTHSLAVARGWNNTQRVAHSTGVAVDVYRTVKVERAVNGTTAAIHLKDAAISRYLVPDDVLFLTKQIATLIINKARGGYAGKTGNAEMGEVYYHDAFPRYEIERVKGNYLAGKS